MTKLEIACVICGLIGILIYQPTKIKVEKNNVSEKPSDLKPQTAASV